MTGRQHGRRGFTAIELMIVLSILVVVSAMVVPRALDIMRRNAVQTTASDALRLWNRAQVLALRQAVGPGNPPQHYGIWIHQEDGKRPWVALVRSNRALPAEDDILQAGGGRQKSSFASNVIVSTERQPQPRQAGAQDVVLYAQYSTGFPLSGQTVALGKGLVSPSEPVGITAAPLANTLAWSSLRFQTVDHDAAVPGRGVAYDLKVFPVGLSVIEEVGR